MKHLLRAVILCLIPVLGFGQNTDYQLFENFYFTPKAGHGADLEAALAEHNQKYHPVGDHAAQVYAVLNGPNAGKYVWSMGPTTWTKVENRPAEEGHDGHWDEKVSIHIESYDATDFYRLDDELSHFPGPFDLQLLQLWMVDIKDGQEYRYKELMNKVLGVYKDNNYEIPMGVYRRQLSGSHGIDLAMVWFVEGLNWMDEDGPFAKDFTAKYGEGAMEDLVEEWQDIVERMDVELWRFIPEMSGHDGKAVARGDD